MNVASAIHLLGVLGIFPSRAFIPAFVVALAMKLGAETEYIQSLGLTGPTWFTHPATLTILGILAVLELVATKSPEVREALNEFDGYLKAAMAFVVTTGVLSAEDIQTVEAVRQAGFGAWVFAAFLASGVFFLAGIRSATLGLLAELDGDDDLGIQWLISLVEDLWSVFGILILIIYPVILLILAGAIFLAIYLIRRYFRYREEQSKVPCLSCSQHLFPTALICPSCKAEQMQPRQVGLFGRALSLVVADRDQHRIALVEYRRCPACASHLSERTARQTCGACGHQLMGERSFAERYLAHVDARVPKVLGITLGFSLVPVLGAIPAIVYSRLMLVAPFRRYIPTHIGCLVKWLVRLVNLILILLQVVPLLGALMMPAMALLNYWAYRQVYKSSLSN